MSKERRKAERRSGKDRRVNSTAASQLFREDHQRIRGFFEDLEDAPDLKARLEIRDLAVAEVRVHKALMEDLFYPALEEVLEETQLEDVRNDLEGWEALLETIEQTSPDDPAFDSSWRKLERELAHHISWEEQEVLVMLEEKKTVDLFALGLRLAELKREVMAEQPIIGWNSTNDSSDRSGA